MVPAVEILKQKDQESKAVLKKAREGRKKRVKLLIRKESKKHRLLTGQESHLFISNHGGFFYLGLLK